MTTRSPRRHRLLRIGARWVVLIGAVLFIGWITGCMERLFYHPETGPTPAPSGAESVTFASTDGTSLHGWFVPARSGDAAAPTILHAHGNAGYIDSHLWFSEFLVPAGFNVFIFDYRGYGQSDGAARRRADLIADTHAALDHLLSRDDVDPARIGLYGQSLGGAIGLNVMADRDEIRAGVFESPFDSWRRVAANAIGGDPPAWVASWLAWVLIRDGDRPVDAITRIDRPVLLAHGDLDRIVPASHSKRLEAAGGDNVEFLLLTGGEHNTLRATHMGFERRVIDFLTLHLAPR